MSDRDDMNYPYVLGYPFLVGFDRSRPNQGRSTQVADVGMVNCIYQHPERWGVTDPRRFTMIHDVYSLGVVLLEVGLWESFVQWSAEGRRVISSPDILELLDGGGRRLKSEIYSKHVKATFLEMAKSRLPQRMGQKYTNIVLSCLEGTIARVDDIDEIHEKLGIGYINQVVSQLEKLQI
jgi:hypothetical protein